MSSLIKIKHCVSKDTIPTETWKDRVKGGAGPHWWKICHQTCQEVPIPSPHGTEAHGSSGHIGMYLRGCYHVTTLFRSGLNADILKEECKTSHLGVCQQASPLHKVEFSRLIHCCVPRTRCTWAPTQGWQSFYFWLSHWTQNRSWLCLMLSGWPGAGHFTSLNPTISLTFRSFEDS